MAEGGSAGGVVEQPGREGKRVIEGDPRRAPALLRELARSLAEEWLSVVSSGAKPIAVRVSLYCLGGSFSFLLTRPALQTRLVLVADETGRVVIVFDTAETAWRRIAEALLNLLSEWYNARGPIRRVEVETLEVQPPGR